MIRDPDVQYLRDLARGYANSFVDGWQAEHRRLNAIADRLEGFLHESERQGDPGTSPQTKLDGRYGGL